MKHDNSKIQKSLVENGNMNEEDRESFSCSLYNKKNFKKFCELKEGPTAKSIDKLELPQEFDEKLCDFINLRRKTAKIN